MSGPFFFFYCQVNILGEAPVSSFSFCQRRVRERRSFVEGLALKQQTEGDVFVGIEFVSVAVVAGRRSPLSHRG